MNFIKELSEEDQALCALTEADVTDMVCEIGIGFSDYKGGLKFNDFAEKYFRDNLYKFDHNESNPTFYYEIFKHRFNEIMKPLRELDFMDSLVTKRVDSIEQSEKNILILSYLEFVNDCEFKMNAELLTKKVNHTLKLFKMTKEISIESYNSRIAEIIKVRDENDEVYKNISKYYKQYCEKHN